MRPHTVFKLEIYNSISILSRAGTEAGNLARHSFSILKRKSEIMTFGECINFVIIICQLRLHTITI